MDTAPAACRWDVPFPGAGPSASAARVPNRVSLLLPATTPIPSPTGGSA
ncbi:putative ABC transporter ATP-binding protein [Streptomyces sp. Tu6071]|nr:putative ABC transporter ATP-binding protein [Streptomyces sp. Tu6071]